ncbi:MAG: hypothetical protein IRZ32_16340 [Solirubrobacteraceae bacterium]|nr:hypothetical protein [Solirubrobacteraceae bacterium]
MPRRRLLLAVLACALLAPAAAHAQATPSGSGGTTECPSLQVLHNDRIGQLTLPAGAYTITITTPSTLTCAAAADWFRQFLQDWDGRLPAGWRVDAATSSFSRTSPNQAFSVRRTGAQPPSGGPSTRPAGGDVCPAVFEVSHDDHVGALAIPQGRYVIVLVSTGRLTCDQAATSLARFMQDFDGTLPRPWFVDTETATFLRGSLNVGFRLEPLTGDPPSRTTLRLPGDGTPCPGTFQVQHDDRIGRLRVPKGPYLFVPLANSGLSCSQVADLIRDFLAEPGGALPRPWRLNRTTGTLRRGAGSDVGFRIKPALR